MNPYRRTLLAALGAAALVHRLPALAQGRPFTELNPPLAVDAAPGKIEVAEYFWYGCIHCYNLEPVLEGWLKRLPQDVHFRRVPAIFNQRMAEDAAVYYAFESLNLVDKLHMPFFDAIHKGGLKPGDRDGLNQFLQKNGVDAAKFADVMKSFGVQSKVKRAAAQTVQSKIDGTPAMLVHGRYQISAQNAGTREGFIKAAETAVELARKQK